MQKTARDFCKPLFVLLFMLGALLVPETLYADFRFFGSRLAVDLVESDTLYAEYAADPYSLSSGLKYLRMTDFNSVPSTILATNGSDYVEIPFAHYSESEFGSRNAFWQIKGFVNLNVARIEYDKLFKAELSIAGGLNSVFQAFGGTDSLGFDGIWRLAGTVRLFDTVSVRFGTHHFSGHWGDETLSDLPKPGDDDYVSYLGLEEYVRGNSRVLGISVDPLPWARVYFEAELPEKEAWMRPGLHIPAYCNTPGGENLATHVLAQEGLLDEVGSYDESYKAWRLQTGAEFRLALGDWGSLFAAGDFQFHQDGQTRHRVGLYSKTNPWEFEYTAGGGFEYKKDFIGRRIRIETYFHSGRFPLTNYFFQRSNYVSFGLAINN